MICQWQIIELSGWLVLCFFSSFFFVQPPQIFSVSQLLLNIWLKFHNAINNFHFQMESVMSLQLTTNRALTKSSERTDDESQTKCVSIHESLQSCPVLACG